MDPSRDDVSRLPGDPGAVARDARTCPQHGSYVSQRLFGMVWSRCPECERALVLAAEQRAQPIDRRGYLLEAARIPKRFLGRSFDDFAADSDAHCQALAVARQFAERFDEHAAKGASLIFAGKPGTGKSHLAAAILQHVLTGGMRYATCMDLIRAVRDTWRRDSDLSESDVLDTFSRLRLLVIDEVGMQYGTDGEQTILFDVLDRRYRDMLPTVLVTNQDRDGFRRFVGERSFDRLAETARWVPFDWASYRPTARKASA